MFFVNLNRAMGVHQIALADAMYACLGDKFKFIEFGTQNDMHKEAENGIDYSRPYILNMNRSENNMALAIKYINKADVMRVGGEPINLIKERLINKKLTFRSSERIFKKRLSMFSPLVWKTMYEVHRKYENPNYRLLCHSAYLPNDMQLIGAYQNRMYKFAYYTQLPQLDIDELIEKRRSKKLQIVWCARFIDWKHPEMMIKLAKKLLCSGRDNFQITMIGTETEFWYRIKQCISDCKLEEWVTLTGGMSNDKVLEIMRDSHVFAFTSDRNEGWGVVLNEAMSSGCACVASHAIGSTPFLIKEYQNGLVFDSTSTNSLFEKLCMLYDNVDFRESISKDAYKTMNSEWSAQTAAQRLINLSENLLIGKEIAYEDGPCSKAYPIKTNYIR